MIMVYCKTALLLAFGFIGPLNKSVTIRDCLSSGMTCEYFDFIPNIAVKKCKTCNEDLCNGD
ncbi:unnamed protein product [Acanthoscelides obtectus]|uniref:Uncharacterized protein n=1 Tax=Acanthoscelides obtectus TaxID=200917 RepID=A0A9P0P4D0_ACAOB|nr:unnamed protein product [Acanthoscelides obtectus]CAK1645511.1 hypothetical protein AOBTE_LOCUS14133 [Acanthoscelides obtectus]